MVSKMGDIAAELRLSVASNLSRWVRHVEDVDLVFAVCSCFQVRATVRPFFFRAPAMFRRHRCCGSPGRRFSAGLDESSLLKGFGLVVLSGVCRTGAAGSVPA